MARRKITTKNYSIIGYLFEERGFYKSMTIEQPITYFAQLRGINKKDIQPILISEWINSMLQVKRWKKQKQYQKRTNQKYN